MNDIDLSTEALLKHRAIAEKATPGPWVVEKYNGGPYPGPFQIWNQAAPEKILVSISIEGPRNAAHIAANSPDAVKAHVDEILRLRAEVERLNKEADYLAGVIAAAYCAQENVTHCEKTEGLPLHKLRDACASCWRKAARDTVEGKA